MASMRDIKRRKNSITSTQQITNAMKLVATAKLRRAKEEAKKTRPFFELIHKTIASILSTSAGINHPYLLPRQSSRNTYIVITSNKGLAGGYNGNICKQVLVNDPNPEGISVLAVGRKGSDLLRKKGYTVLKNYHDIVEDPSYKNASEIGDEVIKMYNDNEIDNVYLAYTKFNSSIAQEPMLIKVLPLSEEDFEMEDTTDPEALMNYEPNEEEVLDHIVPKYVNSIIYGALRESVASEHGARMTAMESATKNASDMIDDLTLQYNRARQASITQELAEIVGGAEALK
jgi:F-type H+-transporting ATPase subunit gamma